MGSNTPIAGDFCMDQHTTKVINRLRSGPYDATAFKRIREELTLSREQLVAQRQQKTLAEMVDLLASWARSATDGAVASRALYEAASIAEVELKTEERAAQLYALSLESDCFNYDALDRLEQLLMAQKQYRRLETALEGQGKALLQAGEPTSAVRARVFRSLGKLRVDTANNIDGAIEAFERVLDAEPELSDVRYLAGLYESRRKPGDAARSADLYFTLGDITEGPERVAILEKSLALSPTHDGALALLEKTIEPREQGRRLQGLWAAYVEKAPPGPSSDARRRLLAQAYCEEGRYPEALAYLDELVKKGDSQAQRLYGEISAMTGGAAQGRASSGPVPASSRPSTKPPRGRVAKNPKKTLVGYKVSDLSGNVAPPLGAVPISNFPMPPVGMKSPPPPSPPPPSPPPPPVPGGRASGVTDDSSSYEPVSTGQVVFVDEEDEFQLRKKFPVKWITMVVIAIGAIVSALLLWPQAKKPTEPGQSEAAAGSSIAAPVTGQAGSAVAAPPPAPLKDIPKTAAAGSPAPSGADGAEAQTAVGTAEKTAQEAPPAKQIVEEQSPAAKKTGKGASPSVVVTLDEKSAKYMGGKIDKKLVLKALDKKIPDLERCYTKALAKKPRLKGSLSYGWTVKKTGQMVSLQKLKSTITDNSINSCVMATLKKTTFPKPKAKTAQLRMAWTFAREQ
jgi:tetratricopeptide (TPR) repeat protein